MLLLIIIVIEGVLGIIIDYKFNSKLYNDWKKNIGMRENVFNRNMEDIFI